MSDSGEQNSSTPTQGNPSSNNDEHQQSGDANIAQPAPDSPPTAPVNNNQTTDNTQQQNNNQQQNNTQQSNSAQQQRITVPVCNGINEHVPSSTDSPPVGNGSLNEDEVALVMIKTNAFPQAFPPIATNPSNGVAMKVTANEMEVMELKVKVICQEKNILALKMELRAAELQVDAKK
jgi:hypothetical protein